MQEIHYFLQRLLGFIFPGHILECNSSLFFHIHLGVTFADSHYAAAFGHLAHQPDKHGRHQTDWQDHGKEQFKECLPHSIRRLTLELHTRLVKSLHQCIIVDISGIVIRISLGFFIAASRLYLFLHLAPDISRICDLSVFFQFFLTRLIRQCDVDPVAVETYFLYLFVIYERKEFIIADFLRTGSPHHGI